MVKPRGLKYERFSGITPGVTEYLEIESIDIVQWCPNTTGTDPTQVHMLLRAKDININFPLLLRFKSPDTLGVIIDQLARHRREVWPGAEKLEAD